MAYGRNDRDFPSRGQDDERQRLAGRWVYNDETGDIHRRFDDGRGSDEAYRGGRAPANRDGAAGPHDAPNRRGDGGGGHAFDFARQDSGRSGSRDREDQRVFEGGGRVRDPEGYATRSGGGFDQDYGDRGGRELTGPSRGVWPQRDNWISRYDGNSSGEQPAVRTGSFRGRGPKGYVRSDDRIREDVSDRLSDDDTLDASDITVEVAAGEVTLSGYVTSRQAKHTAEDCAEQCAGVVHVQNNLRVRAATGQGSNGQPGEQTKTTDL